MSSGNACNIMVGICEQHQQLSLYPGYDSALPSSFNYDTI